MKKNWLLLLGCVSMLAGCAGTAVVGPKTAEAVQLDEGPSIAAPHPLYMLLVRKGDAWVFANTLNPGPPKNSENQLAVSVSGLMPARSVQGIFKIYCRTRGYVDCEVKEPRNALHTFEGGGIVTEDIIPQFGPFMTGPIDPARDCRENHMLACAYIGVTYNYAFDARAFNKALSEAVDSRGLTYAKRRKILSGYDSLMEHAADLIKKGEITSGGPALQSYLDSFGSNYPAAMNALDAEVGEAKRERLADLKAQIRQCEGVIELSQAMIKREKNIGRVSGYVDTQTLYQAGEAIVTCRQRIMGDYAQYRKDGGHESLAQISRK